MSQPETVLLGGDLRPQRLGFGALHLTGPGAWGEPADPAGAKRLLRHAVALGVDFIDTADSYGPEVSERLIAEALYPYPENLVIATKGGMVRTGPSTDMWPVDARPERLRAACEDSLRRLRLERLDLYQLHAVDPEVPVEESVGALVELQAEGKIRHIGVSNVTADELARARSVGHIVSVQNRYSLTHRASEDVLDACERDGLVFLPWWPLDFGALAAGGEALARVAAAHRASVAQIALAWLLHRSPAVLAIPGTSSVEHLRENLAAATVTLGGDELESLSRAAASG